MIPAPPDDAWRPAAERRLGGPVEVTRRVALSGGYVADAVTRVDLDVDGRTSAVVVKRTSAVEVAALRALATVPGVDAPRLIATGRDQHGVWVVTPHYAGSALAEGPAVPVEVWTTLARVHAHWWGRRPRGVPVADAASWRALCLERTLPHLVAVGERCADPAYADAAAAVRSWADDPRMLAASTGLPRTLVHGDAHRGNVLLSATGAVLIDWGNAKVAPAALDLAVLRAQGATDDSPYRVLLAELGGEQPPERVAVETCWGEVRAHVGYLGFAADHLGPGRVTELVEGASRALDALGGALHRALRAADRR